MDTRHPCFDPTARHTTSRVHLPVAPACNIQCNYCSRSFDCVNESRPGVTTKVLSPEQASWWLGKLQLEVPDLEVVGIAGPGDPCANPTPTLRTLRLVRAEYPQTSLCLSTNGLALPDMVDALVRAGVTHLTVTVNAVEPSIGARIYRWVRSGDQVLRGEEGAALLISRQLDGITRAAAAGLTVKVNSVLLPSVNDEHLIEVATRVREAGASFLNLIPLRPIEGTPMGTLAPPSPSAAALLRRKMHAILPVLSHCGQCRADAAGKIGAPNTPTVNHLLAAAADVTPPGEKRVHVAVASVEGIFVNCHLGHARELLVYAEREDEFELVDVRKTPPEGGADERWEELADLLFDCRAVVASAAGAAPERALSGRGISLLCTEGLVEDALEIIFGGRQAQLRPPSCSSGSGCGSPKAGGRSSGSAGAPSTACGGGLGLCG